MKIFLDTAQELLIEKWLQFDIIDGVTTNPTHLAKVGGNPWDVLEKICALMGKKEVSVEVTKEEPQEVYLQALKIAKISENVVVKIPCHVRYYKIIKDLLKKNIRINITLVFTLFQSMCMAKLGVHYISPFVGRLDDLDCNGSELLYEIREMLDRYNFDTKLLAASLRSVRHLHHAMRAGVDIATLPESVLEKACMHPLTEDGIEKFIKDWKKSFIV